MSDVYYGKIFLRCRFALFILLFYYYFVIKKWNIAQAISMSLLRFYNVAVSLV